MIVDRKGNFCRVGCVNHSQQISSRTCLIVWSCRIESNFESFGYCRTIESWSIKAGDVTGSVQEDRWSGRGTKLGLKGTVMNCRMHVSIIETLPKYKNPSRDVKRMKTRK